MTNFFTIYFSDLTSEAQEGVRRLVEQRVNEDGVKLMELEKLALDKHNEVNNRTSIEDILNSLISEKVEYIINREFSGKGEV